MQLLAFHMTHFYEIWLQNIMNNKRLQFCTFLSSLGWFFLNFSYFYFYSNIITISLLISKFPCNFQFFTVNKFFLRNPVSGWIIESIFLSTLYFTAVNVYHAVIQSTKTLTELFISYSVLWDLHKRNHEKTEQSSIM